MALFRKPPSAAVWESDSLPFPSWPRFFHILFQSACAAICGYWTFHLPAPGNAVLAIGVAAVLMTSWGMKWQHKAVWLLLVFFLAFLETKSIHEDREQATKDQDAAFGIARGTADTATQTLTTVTLLGNKMDYYRDEIRKAENNHDTRSVAQFRTEKEATQKQLLLSLAPGVLSQMRYWAQRWEEDDRPIELHIRTERGRTEDMSQKAAAEVLNPLYTKRSNLNELYTKQVLPAVTNAFSLRNQLLDGPPSTAVDKAYTVTFDKVLAGIPIQWNDMTNLTTYMRDFIDRFTPRLLSNQLIDRPYAFGDSGRNTGVRSQGQ
jgi:hypothetical protein